jgi:uncharacterized protein (DUF433 family)
MATAMQNGKKTELLLLGNEPRYPIAEAARLARLKPQTLRRWTKGYRYDGGQQPPVLRSAGGQDVLSFVDLLEAAFLRAYREKGISLQRIRAALDYAAESLKMERPLVYHQFLHDGKDLFARFQDEHSENGLLNLSRGGQAAWPEVVDRYLHELDYEDEIAIRWWPEGKSRHVIIDPRFAFGSPVVTSKMIRTELVAERWEAGEKMLDIAGDFDVPVEEVEEALRYEQVNYATAV